MLDEDFEDLIADNFLIATYVAEIAKKDNDDETETEGVVPMP